MPKDTHGQTLTTSCLISKSYSLGRGRKKPAASNSVNDYVQSWGKLQNTKCIDQSCDLVLKDAFSFNFELKQGQNLSRRYAMRDRLLN